MIARTFDSLDFFGISLSFVEIYASSSSGVFSSILSSFTTLIQVPAVSSADDLLSKDPSSISIPYR